MKITRTIVCLGMIYASHAVSIYADTTDTDNNLIINGVTWFDDSRQPVNAHGACLLQENGIYWLFGEYKTDSINNFNGFSCYSSPDLVNWRFERIALPVQDGNEADGVMLGKGSIGERPKVMRSKTTGKYVMLAHTDNAYYKNPAIGVAVADSINGAYRLLGAIEYQGNPIRKWDMGTFTDDDGTSYLLIHHGPIYRLSDDLLCAEEMVADVNGMGESPAMFKKDGIYYLLTSHTTSWERNDNYYFTAPSISGPWTPRGTFAPEGSLTFNSQTTYVFPLPTNQPDGSKDSLPMFMGDRWSFPIQSSAASYVWLPMEASDSILSIPKYMESWDPKTMESKQITGKRRPIEWKSDVKGEYFTYDFKGKRISIEGLSTPHGGYGLVEIYDMKGKRVFEKLTDFYSKAPYNGLLFRSPELTDGEYRLKVTVSGLQSEWFDKRGNRFGTDGTNIVIKNLIIE